MYISSRENNASYASTQMSSGAKTFELNVDGDTTHYSTESCSLLDIINNMFMQAGAAENICKCATYES